MPTIHPTAVLTGEINLADDVEIGAYCVLNGEITLGAGVRLGAHVNLQGPLTIGEGTRVYPGSSLGFEPQDYKFTSGMPTAGVEIGSRCLIRENTTVHAASNNERATRVGDGVFMMVGAHVGHDAIVGDEAIMVNNTALAGHSELMSKAIMSGGSMLHQFCRIGRMVMCSGGTIVTTDVPPFCIVAERNSVRGLNLVGLRRSGASKDEINAVREAFRKVLRVNPPRDEMLGMLEERGVESAMVREMYEFVLSAKKPITPVVRKAAREGIEA